jgi:hypothetical protein
MHVTIEVEVKRISEKAWLIKATDVNNKPTETWIPKSQIIETDCLAEGDKGYMVISDWIAKQKKFVKED